jgi:hypothetical protein
MVEDFLGENMLVVAGLGTSIYWNFDEVAHGQQLFDSYDGPIVSVILVVAVQVDVVLVAMFVIFLLFLIDIVIVVVGVRDVVIGSVDIPIDVLEVV